MRNRSSHGSSCGADHRQHRWNRNCNGNCRNIRNTAWSKFHNNRSGRSCNNGQPFSHPDHPIGNYRNTGRNRSYSFADHNNNPEPKHNDNSKPVNHHDSQPIHRDNAGSEHYRNPAGRWYDEHGELCPQRHFRIDNGDRKHERNQCHVE